MKPALPFASVFLVTLTAACGSDRGSNVLASFPGAPDGAFVRPDGTAWIVDPSEGGQADGLHLEELRWGRLVDVRDQDGILRHRDLLVEESVEAGGATYRVAPAFLGGPLEVTVSASFGSPAWHATLEAMKDEVEVVRTRGFQEDLPPFTAVPRNAALELRFSDLLDPTTIDAQTVQVRTGLGLDDVHEARILPDPNHGGLAAGRFLPSRVLVDLAVERAEALATGLPLNPVGVPGSTTTALPNLGLALPTRSAPGAGQFRILTNPAGKGLAASGSGPVDTAGVRLGSSSPSISRRRSTSAFILATSSGVNTSGAMK